MGKKILIVEDYPANILILTTFIEQLGHECDVAESGEDAVEKVRGTLDYQLLFMDLNLPKMDGYDTCAAIRRIETDDARAKLPIVGLSADVNDHAREKGALAGMDGLMVKSMSFEDIASAIDRYAA